ncbi:spore germination protein GerPC [Melghirimyces profundicolus]|uniref:Spore germination protein GerPC n=1 Tax=Melghirimyces profundicolus TaxID=1242148 RepID=A0A2T6BXB2_9BACL|nr:spore germination protein GerPC [Melghirimyces profundicolus]PTX60710.1 spore germination protein GerPC [Melghirimyces profundicolus]
MYAYLWDRINRMEQELEDLRKENQELRKKIDSIQPVSIEQLVYKIQELNVQTLSGTLNVGLTAQGDGENVTQLIEKLHREGKTQFEIGDPEETHTVPLREDESSSASVDPPGEPSPETQPDADDDR